jgi:hypothetical protein
MFKSRHLSKNQWTESKYQDLDNNSTRCLVILGFMDLQTKIVSEIARRECQRITNCAIRTLQKMNQVRMLSGDDSELENYWDEICVQVQYEHSFFWDAYTLTIDQIIEAEVNELTSEIQMAIWLQTQNRDDWDAEGDYKPESVTEDVVSHIVHKHIFVKAERWSNWKIRAYLEHCQSF